MTFDSSLIHHSYTSIALYVLFWISYPEIVISLRVTMSRTLSRLRLTLTSALHRIKVDLHTALERKLPQAFLARVRQTQMVEYPNAKLAASGAGPVSAFSRVFHFVMQLLTPSHGSANSNTFGESRRLTYLKKHWYRSMIFLLLCL